MEVKKYFNDEGTRRVLFARIYYPDIDTLNDDELAVFVRMIRYAGSRGQCRCSLRTLQAKGGRGYGKITEVQESLKKKGLIKPDGTETIHTSDFPRKVFNWTVDNYAKWTKKDTSLLLTGSSTASNWKTIDIIDIKKEMEGATLNEKKGILKRVHEQWSNMKKGLNEIRERELKNLGKIQEFTSA